MCEIIYVLYILVCFSLYGSDFVLLLMSSFFFFFFFKQKTAYEMRISDWSSDVCSSDLFGFPRKPICYLAVGAVVAVGTWCLNISNQTKSVPAEPVHHGDAGWEDR